jgi:hypothetical protein
MCSSSDLEAVVQPLEAQVAALRTSVQALETNGDSTTPSPTATVESALSPQCNFPPRNSSGPWVRQHPWATPCGTAQWLTRIFDAEGHGQGTFPWPSSPALFRSILTAARQEGGGPRPGIRRCGGAG